MNAQAKLKREAGTWFTPERRDFVLGVIADVERLGMDFWEGIQKKHIGATVPFEFEEVMIRTVLLSRLRKLLSAPAPQTGGEE